jgi:hypothetical protein
MKKIRKVGKRSKKHFYGGTKAFLEGRKPDLFVHFGPFNTPGCGSRKGNLMRIHADPDSFHNTDHR